MEFKAILLYFGVLVLSLGQAGISHAQTTGLGTLTGRVTDAQTKEPLAGANVFVVGTNTGAVTDLNGEYMIRNIRPGKQHIRVSYIGYQTKEIEIVIESNTSSKLDIALRETALQSREVVVTAQRSGQQSAINQQLSSNSVVNVVAADRLQENPDANAAEAIGRLPGVSLIRSGGEGIGIVIRGLQPQYSRIFLDGVPLPSTDNDTRATSVAGISQYVLQGVEVFKSITPDMQGDATGGAINMKLNEAPPGLKYSLMAEPGYNNLNNYWKNYKFVGNISRRFFHDRLGAIAGLDMEGVNRSDQTLGASYETKTIPVPGQLAPLFASSINLNDIKRINTKVAGTLVLDYELSSVTKLRLFNFFSHYDQDYTQVSKNYDLNAGDIGYTITDAPNNYTELYVGSLEAKHAFSLFELNEGLALTQSHVYTPDSRNWTFYYTGIGLTKYGSEASQSLPLGQILASATDTLSDATLNNFYLYNMARGANDLLDRQMNAFVNCKIPFNIGDYVSVNLKLGADLKETWRNRLYDSRHAGISVIGDIPQFGTYATQYLSWAGVSHVGTLSMQGLYGYKVNNFMKSQYNFGWYPNIDRLNEIFNWWTNFSNYYLYTDPKDVPPAFSGGKLGFYPDWYGIETNTQRFSGSYYAGYVMGELNFGNILDFLMGVRGEKERDNLNGWWIETIPYPDLNHPSGYPTHSIHSDEYWLPNLHLKFKTTSWMQILLSYTRTLNRPDYHMLIPNVYLNRATGAEFYQSGNPDLRPEAWTNYDAQVAVFGDKIGLVSADVFYKTVRDMIWTPSIYRTPGQPWLFGAGQYFGDNSVVLITVPQNSSFPVHLRGLEFEAQTNLWYLPEPFSYISFDANLTLISSETKYEYSKTQMALVGRDSRGRPIMQLVSVDSIYGGPMLNQPKTIANLSLGYNYKGFNMWLSYQYTGEMVTSFPNITEFEMIRSPLSLWDLQITQRLPVEGLAVLFDLANINNAVELQNYLGDPRPAYLENYGWTLYLGLRYGF